MAAVVPHVSSLCPCRARGTRGEKGQKGREKPTIVQHSSSTVDQMSVRLVASLSLPSLLPFVPQATSGDPAAIKPFFGGQEI